MVVVLNTIPAAAAVATKVVAAVLISRVPIKIPVMAQTTVKAVILTTMDTIRKEIRHLMVVMVR